MLKAARWRKTVDKKRGELRRAHFTRGHDELAVLDRAGPTDVSGDRDIVRRIAEHHLRPRGPEQALVGLSPGGVAADQPVLSDVPDIAKTGDRIAGKRFGNAVGRIGLIGGRAIGQLAQGNVDLGQLEPGERQVVVELERREILELQGQQVTVPAGILGKLVVGDHIGANVGFAHVAQANGRDQFHPDQLRRRDPAVAGDDAVVFVHEHRIDEPEMPYGARDLRDLFLGMRARVRRPKHQRRCRLIFDFEVGHLLLPPPLPGGFLIWRRPHRPRR